MEVARSKLDRSIQILFYVLGPVEGSNYCVMLSAAYISLNFRRLEVYILWEARVWTCEAIHKCAFLAFVAGRSVDTGPAGHNR